MGWVAAEPMAFLSLLCLEGVCIISHRGPYLDTHQCTADLLISHPVEIRTALRKNVINVSLTNSIPVI